MQSLTAGYVYNIAIGGRNRDCADRLRILPIENRIPGATIIRRFPNPAIDLAHVENIRLIGNTGGGACATSAKRADHAPMHIRHGAVVFRGQTSSARNQRAAQQQDSYHIARGRLLLSHFHPFSVSRESQQELQTSGNSSGTKTMLDFEYAQVIERQVSMRQDS